MSLPKGGRGKKAPYETQQMRVPLPIKDDVNKLIASYRGLIEKHQVINTNDLESLKNEIQNLNTALINANEQLEKLNTTLEITNQETNNLNTSLGNQEIEKVSTGLEENSINLNTGKSQVELFDNDDRKWLTTKQAHELYGQSITYDKFRKLSIEQLEQRFKLKGDLSKKESNKYNSRWLRKIGLT
jgi:predicted RNase H-like nuclease (RuvC/YqgF family)